MGCLAKRQLRATASYRHAKRNSGLDLASVIKRVERQTCSFMLVGRTGFRALKEGLGTVYNAHRIVGP